MRLTVFWALLAFQGAMAHAAEGPHHNRYLGPHPVAARYGGGYCNIEAPHFHIYPPDHPRLYQQVGRENVFTGDPTPFGYDGPRHAFYGHHPIAVVEGQPVYCYLDGPHYHAFEAQGPGYKVKGDVAFYIGPFEPTYVQLRAQRAPLVNAEYRPFAPFRPVVQVEPPPEWHGEVYVPGPAVQVGAPGVTFEAPQPSVAVHVQVPGVVIGAPPPVVIGGPGVVFGAPRYEGKREHEREESHGHHDNGKHKGWYKH